jgi:hypothetical protein
MCNLRQRSHGGIILWPRGMVSTLATISCLNGPSLSLGAGVVYILGLGDAVADGLNDPYCSSLPNGRPCKLAPGTLPTFFKFFTAANCFKRSERVVSDAPALLSSITLPFPLPSVGLELTATKPVDAPFPFISAILLGLDGRTRVLVGSEARLSRIACFLAVMR